ncbi:acyl transferase/acyl hydrolase/lysophospholipase [Chytridium lagenaria]|nr:acyl transferase/acyl hydrolase/lysophospholipase [Chytridium lagenaria]
MAIRARRTMWLATAMTVSGSSFMGWRWYSSKSSPGNSVPDRGGLHWRPFLKRIFADSDTRNTDTQATKAVPKPQRDQGEAFRLFRKAKDIIQRPFEALDRLPLNGLQEFVQSIPARLGRPDLVEKLSGAAGKVPSPAEVAYLLKKYLTAEELKALTNKVVMEATSKALDMAFEGRLVKRIRYEMNDPEKHPEITMDAKVRLGVELSQPEKKFVLARRKVVADALSKFLGETVDPADVPIIGIAASGGGCRAMVTTLGGIQSLHDLGLLDACTYMAGVSGSTWAMAQLYCVEKSPQMALSRNLMNPLDFFDSFTGPMSELVLTGAVHRFHSPPLKKSLGIVDLFGVLLTSKFLVPEIAMKGGASPLEVREITASKLSHQKYIVEDQILPFPIYSAVTRVFSEKAKQQGDIYQWMEFNPFEVGMVSQAVPDEGFWVPSWSFGRVFENGISKDRLPEMDIGILLGVFGSAFSADFLRIIDEVEDIVSDDVREKLKTLMRERLEIHPILPAQYPNFVYRQTGVKDPIQNVSSIPVMDSGMDNSIPFAPLLRKERETDIIIVFDGSRGIGTHTFLNKAERYAERRSVVLPLPHGSIKPCVVSALPQDDKITSGYTGPAGVVYVPMVRNDTFRDGTFDPAEALFTATQNFFWTEDQVDTVASLSSHNLNCVKEEMKELIREVVDRKKKERLCL